MKQTKKRASLTRQAILLFIFIAIFSCQEYTTMTKDDKARIELDVRQTLSNYYDDIRKSGLTAEFNYLDHSPDFFWVPPGYSSCISYDSVVHVLEENAPKFKSIDNSFESLRIVPLSNDIATYTGRQHSMMTDSNGKIMTFQLVETGVLIKRKAGWKLLSGQTTILNQK
ncbi:MAG: nuclear transport factor 2 family protein [Saprospiraceae bacterium]|nr:nuclear transport factor 2 family protein [Candidatus Vicinibacter proximus]MBL7822964.1 nuclear transport factor 2 family protein [Saprospiraceae bacterium]HRG33340.1 nuclear transport factor 2 family protein [Saprospiraceae bacterium]